jgi:hypothetical protein
MAVPIAAPEAAKRSIRKPQVAPEALSEVPVQVDEIIEEESFA